MARYAIWNKKDNVITPRGEVLSADEWKARYPVAALDSIIVVCAAGEINGGFFGTLGQMRQMWEQQGIDFSACTTNEEILAAIESAEDAANTPSDEPTAEERIAAALEMQNLMAMDDVIE